MDEFAKYDKWNPTPERMQKFLQREVEIAVVNIKRLCVKGFKRIAPDDMLCSVQTMQAAVEVLRATDYAVMGSFGGRREGQPQGKTNE
jgi:hypothetical protein